MRAASCVFASGCLALASQVGGQPIGFDTLPDGAAAADDGVLGLTDAFVIDGVATTIGFDTDMDGTADVGAVFEAAGQDGTDGFQYNQGGLFDGTAPGFEDALGEYFLRAPGVLSGDPGIFVLEFDKRVDAVGADLWDIDGGVPGTEQWRVRVLDDQGTELATADSPEFDNAGPDSLDGKPWAFRFEDLINAWRVELTFIGTKESGIGLGFDQLDVIAACPCDVNIDGIVDILDILQFLSGYFPQDLASDWDGSGNINVVDLLGFLACYFPAVEDRCP